MLKTKPRDNEERVGEATTVGGKWAWVTMRSGQGPASSEYSYTVCALGLITITRLLFLKRSEGAHKRSVEHALLGEAQHSFVEHVGEEVTAERLIDWNVKVSGSARRCSLERAPTEKKKVKIGNPTSTHEAMTT